MFIAKMRYKIANGRNEIGTSQTGEKVIKLSTNKSRFTHIHMFISCDIILNVSRLDQKNKRNETE